MDVYIPRVYLQRRASHCRALKETKQKSQASFSRSTALCSMPLPNDSPVQQATYKGAHVNGAHVNGAHIHSQHTSSHQSCSDNTAVY